MLRNSLVGALCILLFGTANGLKDTLVPVFTIQQLGWGNKAYVDPVASANVLSAVAAMLLARWLADRVGKILVFSIYLVAIALGWIALALMPVQQSEPGIINAFIFGFQILATFLIVAILATAMNLCWTRVAATQFTLYMVCINMGLVVGATLLGPLPRLLIWSGMFFFVTIVFLVALVLLQLMRLRVHWDSLGRLEDEVAEKSAQGSGKRRRTRGSRRAGDCSVIGANA